MINSSSGDRLAQIETLIQQSVIASNERMTRLEQSLAETDNQLKQSIAASNERMTRIEQERERDRQESNVRLTRIEQLVESNNCFLEGFSDRINRYTARMDNLANKLDTFSTRIDGVIFTANQDRQEANLRLAGIQRQLQTVENKVDQLLEQQDGGQ